MMFRSIFTTILSLALFPVLLSDTALAKDEAQGQARQNKLPKTVQRLDALRLSVKRDYPGVRHISVDELKREFSDALLVDVRELPEYETSRLPGAVHAPTAAAVDALREQHPDRTMVLYCTVGVRSAIAAEAFLERHALEGAALEGKGAAKQPPVVNLSGSIFAWANGGEPLEDALGPTTKVHPYSFWWGWRYLDSQRLERSRVPGNPE